MTSHRIVTDFPTPAGRPATLANWRSSPFNQWGFRHVRELLPTAHIARSDAATALPRDLRYLEDVTFKGLDGEQTTLPAGLRSVNTDGFLVLHRGRIASEWYDNGSTPSTQHLIFSVSKSLCGTLGGILVDLGKLDADAPVTDYIPEMKDSVYGTCTVRHLLDMSVGIRFDEDYSATDGDVVAYRRSSGWDPIPTGRAITHQREFLLTLRPDGTPHGETFHYVSPNTDVLGWIYERVCGMTYAEILQQHLWIPMGAEHDAYMTVDPRGAARSAGGLCCSVRDLARFGDMMGNHGVSGSGRQVVPSAWIDDIRKNGNADAWSRGKFVVLFPNGNYRSKWYTPDRAEEVFCGIGIHGQWLYIDPKQELVIVRVSSQNAPFDMPKDLMWLRACRAIASRFMPR